MQGVAWLSSGRSRGRRSTALAAILVLAGGAGATSATGAPATAPSAARAASEPVVAARAATTRTTRPAAARAPKGRLPRATATGTQVRLRWTRPRGVRSTTIESRDETFHQRSWHRVPKAVRGSQRTVSGLRAGHSYRFRLRFRTAARGARLGRPGRSVLVRVPAAVPPQAPDTRLPPVAPPAPVTGLRIAARGSDGVTLDWTPAAGSAAYRVERIDATTGAVERLPDPSPATTRVDVPPPALAGRWLQYRVVATNVAGEAAPSSPVEARAAGLPTYAHYYALGDSYAAGTGLGQPYDDQECARSNQMWAALIDRAIVPEPDRIACSGAETQDVRLSGEGGIPQYPDLGGTQLDLVRRDLATRTGPTLITISIGGNDAQFIPEFTRCVAGDCTADRDTETALIRGPVRANLDATFAQIRRIAPASDVMVVGYPHLFTEDAVPLDPLFALTLTQDERKLANVWAGQIDEEVAASARAHGLHPITDGVVDAFAGHGAGGADPWINGIVALDEGTPPGVEPAVPATKSLHPNEAGNAAYAGAVEAGLRDYAGRVRLR